MKRIYPKILLSAAFTLVLYLTLCQFSNAHLRTLSDMTGVTPSSQSSVLYPIRSKKTFTIVSELVRNYCWRGQNAWDSIQTTLDEIEAIDAEDGRNWRQIMEYWDYVNNSMELNDHVLPDGLNETDALCLVVLGYELNPDGSPRKELIGRLETVLQSAGKYPNARILCSGGVTSVSIGTSEATVMAKWLVEHGIDPDRIILEKKSTTTIDNVRFSLRLLRENYPEITDIAIISSDYHVRCAAVMFNTKIVLEALPLSLVSHAAYPTKMRNSGVKQVQMEGILSLAGLMMPQ